MNWARIYNRIFEIINGDDDAYFSGSRYISAVREVDPYFPDYGQYMAERKGSGKSTSRKYYYYDILIGFKDEEDRVRLVNAILDQVGDTHPDQVAEIRAELGGTGAIPRARVAPEQWNAERLNRFLEEIDSRIASGKYDGAVTIAYTCLEGFLKAFLKARVPNEATDGDIIRLSRLVRDYLRSTIPDYPDQALSMLNHVGHTVDRSRNRFSEAHFDSQADRWLAVFVRDLVNAEIRLLLHFL